MTCYTFQNWVPSTWLRIPTSHNAKKHCVVALHSIAWCGSGWSCLDQVCFYLVRQYFIQIILSKMSHLNLYSCKKAALLHFIQATPQLVLSALIGNFANKVACFSRIDLHPIAKSHVKPWLVKNKALHESDCSFRLFLNSWDWYKTPAKNLNKFFWGGHGQWRN